MPNAEHPIALKASASASLVINGGTPLKGKVAVSGAKNAALPLLFATLLTKDVVTLSNVPQLSDISTAVILLKELGAEVCSYKDRLIINTAGVNKLCANSSLVSSIRASTLILGPLLARHHKVEISLPGGCTIGARPIDIHLRGMESLGAKVEHLEGGTIRLSTDGPLRGAEVRITKASVGATQNILMAATLAQGTTYIKGAAKEPEIVDLAHLLTKMGAKISGVGTDIITVEGVKTLGSAHHEVAPDRIEAGSYMIAAAATGGDLTIEKVNVGDLNNLIEPLRSVGCLVDHLSDTTLRVRPGGSSKLGFRPSARDITTAPYPGFSTDLQPQWIALMALAEGTSVVFETIFENRFGYTAELQKMGAEIILLNNHECQVKGVESLKPVELYPQDLRASFALIIAALATKGASVIHNLSYLDRGYEDVVAKLCQCGADIKRIEH